MRSVSEELDNGMKLIQHKNFLMIIFTKMYMDYSESVICERALLFTDLGLRFPLMWKDLDHFNNRGSEFDLSYHSILLFSAIDMITFCINTYCISPFLFARLSASGDVLCDADWFTGV